MQIRFPIVIEFEKSIKRVIEELQKSFEISIPFLQAHILQNLKDKNLEDALTNMDDLRKEMAKMDSSLAMYYEFLIQYQRTLVQMKSKSQEEKEVVSGEEEV